MNGATKQSQADPNAQLRLSSSRDSRLFACVSSVYWLVIQPECSHPIPFSILFSIPFAFLPWWVLPFVKPARIPFPACLVPVINLAWICQTSSRLIQETLGAKIWNLRTIDRRIRTKNDLYLNLRLFTSHPIWRMRYGICQGIRALVSSGLMLYASTRKTRLKLVQVQKVGLIYAKVHLVSVWLVGYLNYRNGQSCGGNVMICAHQEHIELAFACL